MSLSFKYFRKLCSLRYIIPYKYCQSEQLVASHSYTIVLKWSTASSVSAVMSIFPSVRRECVQGLTFKWFLCSRHCFRECMTGALMCNVCAALESHLCDPWVGALAVNAVVLQPLALWVRAVLLEGAAVLSFTPDTAKQGVCLQTQTTASTLRVALVQMDCSGRRRERRPEGVSFSTEMSLKQDYTLYCKEWIEWCI